MAYASITRGRVIENSSVVLVARVVINTGANVQQSDVSSITVKVFDTSTATQVGATYSPTVSAVVFNTLQLDARWSIDKTGYNVAIPIANTYFPDGSLTYRVEVKFTWAAGDQDYALWDLDCIDIFSE